MPRTATPDDDEDDDWEDEENGEDADSEDWESDDDDLPTIPCPYCGTEMIEESIRCPQCGRYRSDEDSPAEPKPTWIIVGFVLALIAAFFWLTH